MPDELTPLRSVRKRDDGVWVETDEDRVVSEPDAAWVLDIFRIWELPVPPGLRRQLDLGPEPGPEGGEASDRMPRNPRPPVPSGSEHLAIPAPTENDGE